MKRYVWAAAALLLLWAGAPRAGAVDCSAASAVVMEAETGRVRKYYRITEAGVRHIDEFLRERDDVVSIYDYVKRGARQ